MAGGTECFELLACPECSGELSELWCASCGRRYEQPDGIPDLRRPSDERTARVRDFYTVAPFPGYPPGETIANIRSRLFSNEFVRLLDEAIPLDARIVEIGCGTGQMSLCLAQGNRRVIGADLTRPSLKLAADAADRFGIERLLFVETDLRRPGLRQGAFDVVYCSGVLHHTPDPRASFAAVAKLLKPGGVMVLGLYHAIARLPHRFRRAIARMTGFRMIPWDPVLRARMNEPERRQAWLRDQYQHPEEHRHTIAEVKRWFSENGIRYLRTYPSTLVGAAPLQGTRLFMPAEDDWFLERGLSQLGWMGTLSKEGGLWVTIGAASEPSPQPEKKPTATERRAAHDEAR